MNILKTLTLKNLKLNKKRTIVTIIGVMLLTALICAVSGLVTSTRQSMINAYKTYDGNYYERFENIPNNQLPYIEENEQVKDYFLTRGLGYAELKDSKNEDKPYVYVMEFDKKALENSGLKLTDGRMPENNNEIVISQSIIDNARVHMAIGDDVTFNIGTRKSTLDGSELGQSNPFIESKDKITLEQIVDTKAKTYKVVGIVDRVSYSIEDYSAAGYTCISYLEDGTKVNTANVSVLYKSAKGYEDTTKNILKELKNNTGKDYNTTCNSNLARMEGGLNDETTRVLLIISGIVIAIILVSSVFVIRNSFIISVSEKTKQYGILTSVGATSKQIKKSVLFEGLIIGSIGIILGIILGVIAVVILIWIMNFLLADMLNDMKFVYSIPFIAFVVSAIISAITIYLSCIIPARKAAKISPIEAIRGNNDIKVKAKKLKVSKLTKKIFGIGGVIAKKNLKRSKKKYRTTVISLVVSIAIFVSLSSFLEYGKKTMNLYYKDLSYNITVLGNSEDIYKEIVKTNNIDNYSYSKYASATIDINKYGTELGKNLDNQYKENYANNNSNDYKSSIAINVLNKDYFEKFAKEIGIKSNDYKNMVILEDDNIQYNKNKTKTVGNIYNVNEGDTITVKIKDEEKSFVITKRSDKRPMGQESVYANGGSIYVSEESGIAGEGLSELCINVKDPDELENKLLDLKKANNKYSDISIVNLNTYAKQMKSLILLMSIFLYGFIAVITLIGVTNIFNTITTNMILRSKEFAMLKSIGMTSNEFNRMIRLESILYGFKSLIIGLPIGLLGSYAIYKGVVQSIDFGYLIPWKAIIISIVFVFIIVGLTMKYSLNKINKQNIIETIREENT